ncbi:hypothetical protein [Streptomyces carpaticus]|uniref:Uncharacterized protein n=1 Tax=Streptomyces carpaticus TaxID=285558 RepID=A0ABV4ZNH1_9ACTN
MTLTTKQVREMLDRSTVTLDHATVDLGVASQQMFTEPYLGASWTVTKDRADKERLVLWGKAPFGKDKDRSVEVHFVPRADRVETLIIYVDTKGDWTSTGRPYHSTLKNLGCETPEIAFRASVSTWPMSLDLAGAARFGSSGQQVPNRLLVRSGSPGFSSVASAMGAAPPSGALSSLFAALPLTKEMKPDLSGDVTELIKGVSLTLTSAAARFREPAKGPSELVGLSVRVRADLGAGKVVIPEVFTAQNVVLDLATPDGKRLSVGAELTGTVYTARAVLSASYAATGYYRVCGVVSADQKLLARICDELGGISIGPQKGLDLDVYVSLTVAGTDKTVEVGLNGTTTQLDSQQPIAFEIRGRRSKTATAASAFVSVPLPTAPEPSRPARDIVFSGTVTSRRGDPLAMSLTWRSPTSRDDITWTELLRAIG